MAIWTEPPRIYNGARKNGKCKQFHRGGTEKNKRKIGSSYSLAKAEGDVETEFVGNALVHVLESSHTLFLITGFGVAQSLDLL